MNKRLSFWILGCLVASIALVVLLFAMSGIMKDQRNSFLRQFPPHPVNDGPTFNVKYSSYYIAGATQNHIYLGNYKSPLHLLVLTMTLTDTQHVTLKVKGIYDQKFWSARVKVDSPYYYLTDGAVPILFTGRVTDWTATKYPNDSIYFRDLVPLTPGSYFVKSLSGSTGENVLGKITTAAPYQRFTDRILEKQLDGVFCTDGMMHYEKEENRLVYLYYYRNQFMVTDSSLNVIYRGNTIDTTSKARIKTATIESENSKTLSSPPFIVNKRSDVSENWLFVNSNLLAHNEPENAFDKGSVLDIYDLSTGRYSFSFYIYALIDGTKMTEFKVFGNKMVVLFEHVVKVYELKPEFFKPNGAAKR